MRIHTLDTTLRDGVQGELVTFGVEQKLRIAERLDAFGIDTIEAGWPGSNPADAEFFRRAKELKLTHARLAAFGPVRPVQRSVDEDPQTVALADTGTRVVTLFANFWELAHEERQLDERIRDSITFFKKLHREVIFDASHFFDFHAGNPELAMQGLEAAHEAGADTLVLCDTLGGALTANLVRACAAVRCRMEGTLGIHTHNDAGLGVANTMAAVEEGFSHVQGAINGYGERCGVADLGALIANLELKMHYETVGKDRLQTLSELSRFVAAMANMPVRSDQPYTGRSAFALKGGERLSEVVGVFAPASHIMPSSVGNQPRHLLGRYSGMGDVLNKIDDLGLHIPLSRDQRRELADRVLQLELQGYDLDAADGTMELLVRETANPEALLFEVSSYDVSTRCIGGFTEHTTATVSLELNEAVLTATAEGNGPVHALDQALRKCLSPLYPEVSKMELVNYTLRVLEPQRGSAARARVLIEWMTPEARYSTLGVSESIVSASWKALVDAVRLELLRSAAKEPGSALVTDSSWAV